MPRGKRIVVPPGSVISMGYSLLSNHCHLIAVPAYHGAAAKVLGRLEARGRIIL